MTEGESEEKMYTDEEVEEIKHNHSRDQKMNFMIDQIHDNAKEIKNIKDTLHNGWDKMIYINTWVRRGIVVIITGYIVWSIGQHL